MQTEKKSNIPKSKHAEGQPWFTKVRARWWVILVIIIVFIVIGVPSNPEDQQAEKPKRDSTSGDPIPLGPAPHSEPEAKSTPVPAKTWRKVVELSGAGKKTGEDFHLGGGQKRIKYTTSTIASYLIFSGYVMDADKSLEEDGGFPEISANKAGTSETSLRRSAGDYYLAINASDDTSWTITVEELK